MAGLWTRRWVCTRSAGDVGCCTEFFNLGLQFGDLFFEFAARGAFGQ